MSVGEQFAGEGLAYHGAVMSFTVAAFYHFADWPEFAEWQIPLRTICDQEMARGTILVAPEGINGTIAGSPESIEVGG